MNDIQSHKSKKKGEKEIRDSEQEIQGMLSEVLV